MTSSMPPPPQRNPLTRNKSTTSSGSLESYSASSSATSNNMVSKMKPWQLDWKRPIWETVTDSTNSANRKFVLNSIVLDTSSAQVSFDEVSSLVKPKRNTNNNNNDHFISSPPSMSAASSDRSSTYILTVSLVSNYPQPFNDQNTMADQLVLELIQHTSNENKNSNNDRKKHGGKSEHPQTLSSSSSTTTTTTILCKRILQWPGTVVEQTSLASHDGTSNSFFKKQLTPIWEDVQTWFSTMTTTTTATTTSTSSSSSEDDTRYINSSQRIKQGLTAICLCRVPPQSQTSANLRNSMATSADENQQFNATFGERAKADALDVVQLLSLGLEIGPHHGGITHNSGHGASTRSVSSSGASSMIVPPNTNAAASGKAINTTPATPTNQFNVSEHQVLELQLACVTSTGQVYMYNPWTLLFNQANTVAARTTHRHMYARNPPPYNRPPMDMDHASISNPGGGGVGVGVGVNSTTDSTVANDGANDDLYGLGMASLLFGSHVYDKVQQNMIPLSRPLATIELSIDIVKEPTSQDEKAAGKRDPTLLFDATAFDYFWDPLVEPSTLKYRTVQNRPTTTTIAGEYLVIAGQGLDVTSLKKNAKKRSNQQKHSKSSTDAKTDGTMKRTSSVTSIPSKADWWNESSSANMDYASSDGMSYDKTADEKHAIKDDTIIESNDDNNIMKSDVLSVTVFEAKQELNENVEDEKEEEEEDDEDGGGDDKVNEKVQHERGEGETLQVKQSMSSAESTVTASNWWAQESEDAEPKPVSKLPKNEESDDWWLRTTESDAQEQQRQKIDNADYDDEKEMDKDGVNEVNEVAAEEKEEDNEEEKEYDNDKGDTEEETNLQSKIVATDSTDWWVDDNDPKAMKKSQLKSIDGTPGSKKSLAKKADKKSTKQDDPSVSVSSTAASSYGALDTKDPSIKVGGFITFLSMKHRSETRTLYLPFAPTKVSPIIWQGMSWVLVYGTETAVAILIDSILDATALQSNYINFDMEERNEFVMSVRRFQLVPVRVPQGTIPGHVMGVSSFGTSPPSMVLMYSDGGTELLLLQRSLEAVTPLRTSGALSSYRPLHGPPLTIETGHKGGHMARIQLESPEEIETAWCHVGQGWCLFGAGERIFFVCWEGGTSSRGAYVQHLEYSLPDGQSIDTRRKGFASGVLPFRPIHNTTSADQFFDVTRSIDLGLPFTESYTQSPTIRSPASRGMGERHERGLSDGDIAAEYHQSSTTAIDDIVLDALERISNLNYRDASRDALQSAAAASASASLSPMKSTSPIKSTSFKEASVRPQLSSSINISHREKSARLLSQCSSWNQLENNQVNRNRLEGQVPVVTVYLAANPSLQFVLTLRELMVNNGGATPFQQVLSWLSNREDYFTAASIALDLLHDPQTLIHLWKNAEAVDEDNEQAKLESLLDGIIPIHNRSTSDGIGLRNSLLTQLSDMTVGCLTKGGINMSNTLQAFLRRNEHYDPARACLMLVATTASAVSDDPVSVSSVMGVNTNKIAIKDLMWPTRCLLEVGVSRNYLPTALLLLNVTIPAELRRKQRGLSDSNSLPSMELCKELITLIVACSPDAVDLLMGLEEEETRDRFWSSLHHDTQLLLSHININDKYPLLRHGEVRTWAQEQLNECLENESSSNIMDTSLMKKIPTEWLQQNCVACLRNAGCDLSEFFVESKGLSKKDRQQQEHENNVDGLAEHKAQKEKTRKALIPANGSGGLDFNLIIPTLLLLKSRNAIWYDDDDNNVENDCIDTQSLLDAICYLAGRTTREEPMFSFDSSIAMQQCAIAGNVRAGANLIGGKNGLILSCCDILMNEIGMTMDNAEVFLLDKTLTTAAVHKITESSTNNNNDNNDSLLLFELNDSHRYILWLLDQHVLSVRTFGDFETTTTTTTTNNRGKVDPVFAARICFRTWLCITSSKRKEASEWLESWLRQRLGIINDDHVSIYRLACAAITRALVWPAEDLSLSTRGGTIDNSQILAFELQMKGKFLLQLAQSCCGLVESVPQQIAERILKQEDTTTRDSFSSTTSALSGFGIPGEIGAL